MTYGGTGLEVDKERVPLDVATPYAIKMKVTENLWLPHQAKFLPLTILIGLDLSKLNTL